MDIMVSKKRKTDHIPDELVVEILLRLPARSLLKFRCICKEWRDLIRSRWFIDEHQNHPSQNHNHRVSNCLLLKRNGITTESTTFFFYGRRDDIIDGRDLHLHHMAASDFVASDRRRMADMTAACNGIFCIGDPILHSIHPSDVCYDYEEVGLLLCNPATRQLRRVPDRPFGFGPFPLPENPNYRGVHPRIECQRHGLGLGIDPCTGEYKLVQIIFFKIRMDAGPRLRKPGVYQIEVYHLSSDSWRVVGDHAHTAAVMGDLDLNLFYEAAVFFKGHLHWFAPLPHHGRQDSDKNRLLRFDTRNDMIEMKECQVPQLIRGWDHLLVIRDSIALLIHRHVDVVPIVENPMFVDIDYVGRSQIDIWLMKEYGVADSWFKAFCLGPFHEEICRYTSFQCWSNDTLVFQTRYGELASCNLDDGDDQLRKHDVANDNNPSDWKLIYGYPEMRVKAIIIDKESLLPLC